MADGEPKYDYTINTEILRWEQMAFSDSTIAMLFTVGGVVIFIIIFTSVFCIRNSFAISITEKMKMYGMLSSVGATKKQIKKSVIQEAMILGCIRSSGSEYYQVCLQYLYSLKSLVWFLENIYLQE